jgi:acyl-CoA synthetase (AMP-forming)/AMP-acid ligase II
VSNPTIAAIIQTSCREKGDAVFVADENHALTGIELWRHIVTVAGNFENQGLVKGDVAAFYCGSSVPHSVTFFACLVSGIIPCCLHVRETARRNRQNMINLKAKKIFADPELIANAADLIEGDNVISLSVQGAPDMDATLNVTLTSDDPALILISSGTTGVPKFISHSQKTLAATAKYGPYNYDCWSSDDSTVVVMAPSFAAWIHTVLPFMFIKGRVVFRSNFEPTDFLQILASEKITLAPLVPTVWRMVMAADPEKYDLSHLKTAFYSGEPGSAGLVEDLQAKICSNVMTSYLASEGGCASGVIAGPNILSIKVLAASTGLPVEGAELRIVNPEGAIDDELPAGDVGEIVLRSNSISTGYLDDADLNSEKFQAGWWRSGDLGVLNTDGLLFVRGRLDNRINTGGIKVFAEEIEAALLQHPNVQFAAVIGVPDEKWGERIEAHLVAKGAAPKLEALRAFCLENDLLPSNQLPKEVFYQDTLPSGPTGKLYRRGLTE